MPQFEGQSQINLKASSWSPAWTPILFANSINLVMRPNAMNSKAIFVTLIGDRESLNNFAKSFYNAQLTNGLSVDVAKTLIDKFMSNVIPFKTALEFNRESCFNLSDIPGKNPKVYVSIHIGGLLVDRLESDDPLGALQDFSVWCVDKAEQYSIRAVKAACTDFTLSVNHWTFGGQITEEVTADA